MGREYKIIKLTSDDVKDGIGYICFETDQGNFKMSNEDVDKIAYAYLDAMGAMDSKMEETFEKIAKDKGYDYY